MLYLFIQTNKEIVVSLSLQSISSLAYRYSIPAQEAAERLASFFISLGCHKVYDINLARHLALVESNREYALRSSEKKNLPIISSICPGWICYAEKTNGDLIIPHLSKVRSPQQIMGALLKDVDAKQRGKHRDEIYHVTIMPCFDKKLEASRNDFKAQDGSQDVDCVLTPVELEEILNDEGVSLLDFDRVKLNVLCDNTFEPLSSHNGSTSGGYAENILTTQSAGDTKLELSASRNRDFIEVNQKFAIINGFRNIQTVVQRLKRNALKYDYIEVMACPSGCINGGAQCRPNPGDDQMAATQATKQIYEQVGPIELPTNADSEKVSKLYENLGLGDDITRKRLLYTDFHPVPKLQNLTVNW